MSTEVDEGVHCEGWTLRCPDRCCIGAGTATGVARRSTRSAERPERPACRWRRWRGGTLNANLIFKWLKDPRFAPAAAIEEEPVFLPVEVREDDAPTVPIASPAGDPHGRVQIVLATGHRMTVEGPFDGEAVGRLLRVLARP